LNFYPARTSKGETHDHDANLEKVTRGKYELVAD